MTTDYNTKLTQKRKNQSLGSGNRCGHSPDAPRWFAPPAEHELRPPILRKWTERVRQYFSKPDKIPSLNAAHHARQLQENPDHKGRQMRSERREACCSLLGAIAHYCDLPTLCLSVPQDDGSMRPVTLQTLADRAGLGLRRAERACRDIVDAGLLSVHERAELQADGTFIGHAAIRVVPTTFFGLFGLEEQLKHERKRASQKRTKASKERQPTRTEKARVQTAIGAAMNKLTGKTSRPSQTQTAAAQVDQERKPGPFSQHLGDMKAILAGDGPSAPPTGDQARREHQEQSDQDTDPSSQHPRRGKDPP